MNGRQRVSIRTLIAVTVCGLLLVLAASLFDGLVWLWTMFLVLLCGCTVVLAGVALYCAFEVLRLWYRARFRFTMLHALLFLTWFAVFCAGERFLMTSEWARRFGFGAIPFVREFLLAIAAFYVGVLPLLAWRERRRQIAARVNSSPVGGKPDDR